MGKYIPPSKDAIIATIQPWLRGFIHKEYGSHTNPDDRADLEQEGVLSLLHLLKKMDGQPPRFNSEDEFQFYVKAVIRNAIRDYILKFRSRFGISLFKLRRELKGKPPADEEDDGSERRLGEFMNAVGEQYIYLSGGEEAEDLIELETTQRRLSLLSRATKSCRDLGLDESKALLFDVIEEYKRTETVQAAFETPPPPRIPQALPLNGSATRAPVPAARRGPKKCASRFCNTDLATIKTVIIDRGFGYCSKRCKKEWPPIINRIQSGYGNTPIELILSLSLKLFRSKRRAAEVLDVSVTTFEKLSVKFNIGE